MQWLLLATSFSHVVFSHVDLIGDFVIEIVLMFCISMSRFPLTWKTWNTPGNLLTWKTPGIYVRPGIFCMISRFTLVLTL